MSFFLESHRHKPYKRAHQVCECPAVTKSMSQRSDCVPRPDKVKTSAQNKQAAQREGAATVCCWSGEQEGADEKSRETERGRQLGMGNKEME